MPKCLRCGADAEWIQGNVRSEPAAESAVPILDDSGSVRSIREIQRDVVESVLVANDGDKRITAQELGISVKTLYTWLHSYMGTSPKPHNKRPKPAKRR
jgi:transcriptional regulator with PAS, ATPase and Fis domain